MALLIDNRANQQVVTGNYTEITGEGGSIAPQDELTLAQLQPELDRYHLKVDWTTLDGYFTRLDKKVPASILGLTWVRPKSVRQFWGMSTARPRWSNWRR